jgi:hypothetical protein
MLDGELRPSHTKETTRRSTESPRDEINALWVALNGCDAGSMKRQKIDVQSFHGAGILERHGVLLGGKSAN